jgi:hypothetical protein
MKTTHGYKTVIKYHNFLATLYTQGAFNIYEMCQAHNIGSRLITVMRKRNIIERQDDLYRWIGEVPTQAMARSLLNQCRSDYMQLKNARLSKQLTITNPQRQARAQSIIDEAKRIVAERPQPVAVQHHEPDYDNSNSKMLLIMAVGAVIGFLIATAICK